MKERETMQYTRRDFLSKTARGVLGAGLLTADLAALSNVVATARPLYAWAGTYTRRGQSKGIYTLSLDAGTGVLRNGGPVAQTANPSYLAVHPDQNLIVAVNESLPGQREGAVSAFAVEPKTRQLRLLNSQPGHGGPCHISFDRSGRWALAANYGGGRVAVYPIAEDGRLGEASSVVTHQVKGAKGRPHAHMIRLSPDNRYALAADLGLDRIMVYEFDADKGLLTPHVRPWVRAEAGAGPRHLAFHSEGQHVFVINELDSTVTVYAYDRYKGMLKPVHSVTTLPDGFEGDNHCAALRLSRSGRFVYGSNRGHNSIVTLTFDFENSRLERAAFTPTRGDHPRDFALDPSGAFMLVANTHSNSVDSFRLDPDTGSPQPTGHRAEVPMPTCVVFS